MRTKFVRSGRTNRRELLIAAQRGETLSSKLADRLADDPSALLLNFAYEQQRGGAVLLHYDVDGLWSLRTYLSKRALSVEELLGLMAAVQGVLDLCAQEHLRAEGLLFDPEFVFVDAQCCPHFALVPLEDVPFQTRNSPLALLAAIGDAGKLRFATPDAQGLSRRLGTLVVDLDGVFSINRFRRFVEDEKHQGGGAPAPARDDEELGTGSVWATAGSGGQASDDKAVGTGSFFWSPLSGMEGLDEGPATPAAAPAATPAVTPAAVPASAPSAAPASADVPARVTDAAAAPAPDAPTAQAASAATPAPARAAVTLAAAPAPVPAAVQPARPQPAAVPVAAPIPPVVPAVPPVPSAPLTPSAQAPVAHLVRPATGESFALPLGQQLRVGRGSVCDVRLLGNRKLSRQHVALTNTGQLVMVTDLGAPNGVFVDGQRVGSLQSVLLAPGQRLQLADESFEIAIG